MGAALQSGLIARALAVVIATLAALHIVVVFVLRIGLGHDHVYGLADLFDMAEEGNLPAWFTSALMMAGSIGSMVAARFSPASDPRLNKYWAALALAMLFLSADEAIRIHEKLGWLFLRGTGRGIFFYGWPAVYGPIAALFGLWMLRFLTLLPRRTGLTFALSGLVYVGGAVGMEMVESSMAYATFNDTASQVGSERIETLRTDIPYQIAISIEETLEMAGLALFLVGLTGYVEYRNPPPPTWRIQPLGALTQAASRAEPPSSSRRADQPER